jgi:hypothetical protein
MTIAAPRMNHGALGPDRERWAGVPARDFLMAKGG